MEQLTNDIEFNEDIDLNDQASENISKIFNPENAYKRQQKKIINSIFN